MYNSLHMAKIVPISKVGAVARRLKKEGKVIVLAGGCFDILHLGHVVFLEKAKKSGDVLIIILESDKKVRQLKGINRPAHSQKDRAKVLSALRFVDYVVMLPMMENDRDYDELVRKIKPDVIAASSKDGNTAHHQRTAKLSGAKLKLVAKVRAVLYNGRIGEN